MSQPLGDPEQHGHAELARAARWVLVTLAALLVLAGVWRFTPLGDWLTAARLAGWVGLLPGEAVPVLAVLGGFVVGSLVMVPQTLLTLGTVLAFGALKGGVYAYLGTLLAAAVTYLVGRELGRDTMHRLGGTRVDLVSRYLSHRGIRTMAVMSILPVAPFTLVNLVAGASHIRFWDYFAGTALGVWTGVVAIALFASQLEDLIRHPSTANVVTVLLVMAALAGAGYWLHRRLRRYLDAS